jgi:hypothetical protein
VRNFASRRPLGIGAITVAAVEAAVAAAGVNASLLSAALLVAPGFALAPLLPHPLRRSAVAAVAAAPVLGVAASSIVLISASSAGIPLTGTAVRLVLGATIVLAVALLPGPDVGGPFDRGARLGALGLSAAVVAGILLEGRVLHGSPVPGNDWAKYVLYADEIRRHHALLIDNPYWMLGVPFREDPGAPALYGSFLVLSGQPASTVMHGIWGFAVLCVLSTYAYVRSLWGELSGVLAAAFVGVIPASHDILGWHGLANVVALSELPLALLYLTLLVTRGLDWRRALGFAVLLVGVAAAHRLSLLVTIATVAATLAVAFVLSAEGRRHIPQDALKVVVLVALISPGVVYDLVTRGRTFGGTLSYRSYLSSKVDLSLAASDLTWLFSALGVAALVLAVARLGRDPRLLPPIAFFAVIAALAYAWVVHLPLAYLRMVYFVPVALAPLVAIELVRRLPARWAAAGGGAAALAVAAFAWPQATNVRDFYSFATPATLRGVDAVAERVRPGEVIVTDRCWSFLATWLVHTKTLAALEPADIQPKAELEGARQARAVLAESARGKRLARRLGIRYALADPTCEDVSGQEVPAPVRAKPLFISDRLAVLRLPGPDDRSARGG